MMLKLFLFILSCRFFFTENDLVLLTQYANQKRLVETIEDTVYVTIDSNLLQYRSSDYGFTYKIGKSNFVVVPPGKNPGTSSVFSIDDVRYKGSGRYMVDCSFAVAGGIQFAICYFRYNEYSVDYRKKDSIVLYQYDLGPSGSDYWKYSDPDTNSKK